MMTEEEEDFTVTVAKYFALAFLILAVCVGLFVYGHKSAAVSAQVPSAPGYSYAACTPANGELCPNDAWYADYSRLQELNQQITKDQQSPAWRAMQDKVDQSIGLANRLQTQIPQGYQWSVEKKKFVPIPKLAELPKK